MVRTLVVDYFWAFPAARWSTKILLINFLYTERQSAPNSSKSLMSPARVTWLKLMTTTSATCCGLANFTTDPQIGCSRPKYSAAKMEYHRLSIKRDRWGSCLVAGERAFKSPRVWGFDWDSIWVLRWWSRFDWAKPAGAVGFGYYSRDFWVI